MSFRSNVHGQWGAVQKVASTHAFTPWDIEVGFLLFNHQQDLGFGAALANRAGSRCCGYATRFVHRFLWFGRSLASIGFVVRSYIHYMGDGVVVRIFLWGVVEKSCTNCPARIEIEYLQSCTATGNGLV